MFVANSYAVHAVVPSVSWATAWKEIVQNNLSPVLRNSMCLQTTSFNDKLSLSGELLLSLDLSS